MKQQKKMNENKTWILHQEKYIKFMRKHAIQPSNTKTVEVTFPRSKNNHSEFSFQEIYSPNKEVDEDNSWEEEASAAGVSAEEQDKVAERTEQQHP